MKKRTVGFDFGLKRIGVAITDEMGWFARALFTFSCKKKTEGTVVTLLSDLHEEEKKGAFVIEKAIIGMPLKLSGARSFITDEVDHFIKVWKEKCSIPIIPWDERLTSTQAERMLKEDTSLTRKDRSMMVDSIAAILILQNYLEAQNESSL